MCASVLDFFFFHIAVLFEGVVQSMVFLLHAGKSIIASGLRLFLCVCVHTVCSCFTVCMWVYGQGV